MLNSERLLAPQTVVSHKDDEVRQEKKRPDGKRCQVHHSGVRGHARAEDALNTGITSGNSIASEKVCQVRTSINHDLHVCLHLLALKTDKRDQSYKTSVAVKELNLYVIKMANIPEWSLCWTEWLHLIG
jgi:hypothetical protein